MNEIDALKVTAGVLLARPGISANRPSEAKRADGSTAINAMCKPIKPPKLVPQDTVGIVSPASSFSTINESAFQRGCAYLEKAGLHVQLAPHTLDQRQYLNSPAQHRAEDLNQTIAKPQRFRRIEIQSNLTADWNISVFCDLRKCSLQRRSLWRLTIKIWHLQ